MIISQDDSTGPADSGRDQSGEWVLAAKPRPSDFRDYSLVLSAVGIDHQVDRRSRAILVRRRSSARAMAELQAYREENLDWPPPAEPRLPKVRSASPPLLLLTMLGALVLMHAASGPWLADSPWFRNGAVSSRAVLEQGQWWRLGTALTLHADQMHLVGNCVIGGVMLHLLCKSVGYGTAWLFMLLAAMIGNLLNVLMRSAPHYSVGFSTAIFAAIGILCGLQILAGRSSLARQLLPPLGAGFGLLAMLGSGSEDGRTDVGAHLFGLACGLACGLLLRAAKLDRQGDHGILQGILFSAALALILACWLLASA